MLRVEGLSKWFATTERRRARKTTPLRAVDDVSFTVDEGELFTLVGPSGCGKTTTLRCIAGLEVPDGGSITLDGEVLVAAERGLMVPANRRRLGMVFQSYAIWPHMTVYENVAFPLRSRPRKTRPKPATIRQEVERVLDLMHLSGYEERPATQLSGGQQQRLALARALISRPRILLLDEPLSNLDAKLRESLCFELKRLQRESRQTMIYVTHDQSEALGLSSRVGVMRSGQFEQVDTPMNVYDQPASSFVADFVGSCNLLDGRVIRRDGAGVEVDTAIGRLRSCSAMASLPADSDVVVAIRPEALHVVAVDAPADNAVTGLVLARVFRGDVFDCILGIDGTELRFRCSPSDAVERGHKTQLVVDPARVNVLVRPADSRGGRSCSTP